MPLLYGYILTWEGYGVDQDAPYADQFDELLLQQESFSPDHRGVARLNPAWKSYWYATKSALHDHGIGADAEPSQSSVLAGATYTYPFMVRVNASNGTIIVVSTLYSITDAVIEYFNNAISPNLKRRIIDVHKVSQTLLDPGERKEYAITYFLADVPGYGSNLRSITLYGNDIAEADFLQAERRNFSARKIGVRPFASPRDAGRFNNYGTIQFRSENIDAFEDFLRYAYKKKLYIE